VLIVEDDDVDVEIVTRGLKRRDLQLDVHVASDGSKALEFLRNEIRQDQRNQLIVLLDLNMPLMNGHEFLAELRSDPALCQAIVFVVTTSALESDRRLAYEKNVAGYFVKSNIDGLLDMISNYVANVEFPALSATC
jgi:CheY-like chemotaxis protein